MEDVSGAAASALAVAQKHYEDRVRKHTLENKRFNNMLVAVKAWDPPTPDHQGLKDFAIGQIEMSMDQYEFTPVDIAEYEPDTWHAAQIASAEGDIEHHTKQQEEEVARCKERTEWLTVFVGSLPEAEIPA